MSNNSAMAQEPMTKEQEQEEPKDNNNGTTDTPTTTETTTTTTTTTTTPNVDPSVEPTTSSETISDDRKKDAIAEADASLKRPLVGGEDARAPKQLRADVTTESDDKGEKITNDPPNAIVANGADGNFPMDAINGDEADENDPLNDVDEDEEEADSSNSLSDGEGNDSDGAGDAVDAPEVASNTFLALGIAQYSGIELQRLKRDIMLNKEERDGVNSGDEQSLPGDEMDVATEDDEEEDSTTLDVDMDASLNPKDDDVDGNADVDIYDDDDDDEEPEDPNDPDIFRFSYAMPDFAKTVLACKGSNTEAAKTRSPLFQQPNGDNWRLLIFPAGNGNSGPINDLSVYLECANPAPVGGGEIQMSTDEMLFQKVEEDKLKLLPAISHDAALSLVKAHGNGEDKSSLIGENIHLDSLVGQKVEFSNPNNESNLNESDVNDLAVIPALAAAKNAALVAANTAVSTEQELVQSEQLPANTINGQQVTVEEQIAINQLATVDQQIIANEQIDINQLATVDQRVTAQEQADINQLATVDQPSTPTVQQAAQPPATVTVNRRAPYEIKFTITLVNHRNARLNIEQHANNIFSLTSVDWGFRSFVNIAKILKPNSGYIDSNGAIQLEIKLEPSPDARMLFYDSKLKTGMVGLRNLGATCYLNSLLQTLYHTREFRYAVYSLDTTNDVENDGVALELQRLFWNMQTAVDAAGTRQLTTAFGWTNFQCFTQHDVQELNRELCDKLDERMNGTPLEGTISRLFKGRYKSFIRCINVEYESSREEDFFDIQLDIKGMKNVYESFDKYIETERMDGENMYAAGEHGKQDADKGVGFLSFPPVLHLHLKRFEYNVMSDATVKINDRYEFPIELNLDKYLLQKDGQTEHAVGSDGKEPLEYVLHSVLVHSGDIHCGHYYAFICTDNQQWYKFDDEQVTKATSKTAVQKTFGGEFRMRGRGRDRRGSLQMRWANAYMLVYVRKSELPSIMRTISDEQVPKQLVDRFVREQNEKVRLEEEQRRQYLYQSTFVARTSDVMNFHEYKTIARSGVAIASRSKPNNMVDFVSFEDCESVNLKKTLRVEQIHDVLAKQLRIQPERMRVWVCSLRDNHSTRPDEVIAWEPRENDANENEDSSNLATMQAKARAANAAYTGKNSTTGKTVADLAGSQASSTLYLWLEELPEEKSVSTNNDTTTTTIYGEDVKNKPAMISKMPNIDGKMLIFVRIFDMHETNEARKLRHVGHLFIDPDQNIGDTLPSMLSLAHLPEDLPVELYEIVTSIQCEPLELELSFSTQNLQHGDIVCLHVPASQADVTTVESVVATTVTTTGADDTEDEQQQQQKQKEEELKAQALLILGGGRPAVKMSNFTSPKEWLQYVVKRVMVRFIPLDEPRAAGITLMLRKDMRCLQVMTLLAGAITHRQVAPLHLQFTAPDMSGDFPRNHAAKDTYPKTPLFKLLLSQAAQVDRSDDSTFKLFYNILPIPVTMLDTHRVLKFDVFVRRDTAPIDIDVVKSTFEQMLAPSGSTSSSPPSTAVSPVSRNGKEDTTHQAATMIEGIDGTSIVVPAPSLAASGLVVSTIATNRQSPAVSPSSIATARTAWDPQQHVRTVTVGVPKDGSVRDIVDAAMNSLKNEAGILGGGWDTKQDTDDAVLVLHKVVNGRWLNEFAENGSVKDVPRGIHGIGQPSNAESLVGHIMDMQPPLQVTTKSDVVIDGVNPGTSEASKETHNFTPASNAEESATMPTNTNDQSLPPPPHPSTTNTSLKMGVVANTEPEADNIDAPEQTSRGSDDTLVKVGTTTVNRNDSLNGSIGTNGVSHAAIAAAIAAAAVEPKLVTISHFNSKPDGSYPVPFGHPFTMWVYPRETLGSVLIRIMNRLDVPPAEFIKWRPASFSYFGPPCAFLDVAPSAQKLKNDPLADVAEGGEGVEDMDIATNDINAEPEVIVSYYERVLFDIDEMYVENSVDGVLQLGLKHTDRRARTGYGSGYGGQDMHGSLTIRSS